MSKQKEAQAESIQKALDILREMLTDAQYEGMAGNVAKTTDDFGNDSFRHSIAHTYGELWTRPALSKHQRSLLTIGLMIASGTTTELGHQFKMALKNGFTVRQIEEMIFHSSAYVGLLKSASATQVARQSLGEINVKLTDRTAEDK